MVPFGSIALANGLCLRLRFQFLFGVSFFAIMGRKKSGVLQGCGSDVAKLRNMCQFQSPQKTKKENLLILGIRLGSKGHAIEQKLIIRGFLFLLSMIRRR